MLHHRIPFLLALALALAPMLAATALDPAPESSFSIVVLPDTQGYRGADTKATPDSADPVANPVFEAHTRWIADNIDTQRIAFVTHVGDIVDKNVEDQWEVARKHMDRLHGRVPYGIVVGNHDMTAAGDSSLFQRYFPASRFAGLEWYGGAFEGDPDRPGHSGNNANSYQLFSAAGLDFIILHLECNAPDNVVVWADALLRQHPDRIALISTHMDLGPREKPANNQGYIDDPKGRMRWSKRHGERGNTPEQLWEKLYRKHPNLLLIFSGDQSRTTAMHLPAQGDAGNTVHALLSDYTSSGPLRIYRFRPAQGEIQVITWDTTRNALVEETPHVPGRQNHQFTIKHNFQP